MERIKKYSNISGTASMYANEMFVNNLVCMMQSGINAAMKNQGLYSKKSVLSVSFVSSAYLSSISLNLQPEAKY